MFKIGKLKRQIKQLKEENADLRHELEAQKDLTRDREKFGISEFQENCQKGKMLDAIEEILETNDYNNPQFKLNKIKEVIRPPKQITSK